MLAAKTDLELSLREELRRYLDMLASFGVNVERGDLRRLSIYELIGLVPVARTLVELYPCIFAVLGNRLTQLIFNPAIKYARMFIREPSLGMLILNIFSPIVPDLSTLRSLLRTGLAYDIRLTVDFSPELYEKFKNMIVQELAKRGFALPSSLLENILKRSVTMPIARGTLHKAMYGLVGAYITDEELRKALSEIDMELSEKIRDYVAERIPDIIELASKIEELCNRHFAEYLRRVEEMFVF